MRAGRSCACLGSAEFLPGAGAREPGSRDRVEEGASGVGNKGEQRGATLESVEDVEGV